MSGEQDVVDRLAESIADGKPIDWAEIDKIPVDDHLKRLLALLRVVDGVAEVHRSLGDAPVDALRTDPQTTPATADFEEAEGPIGQWANYSSSRKSAKAPSARSSTRTTRGSITPSP